MKKERIIKYLISFINVIYLEFLYHYLVFKSFNIIFIIYIILFSFLFCLFLDLITSIFNKIINKWVFIAINIFLPILFLAQYINYEFYGNVISIYSIFHGGQVFGFLGAIVNCLKENIIASILLILPIPFIIIFHKKIICDSLIWKNIIYKIIIFIGVFSISLLSLNFDKDDIYSAKNLYFYKHVPNSMAKNFGILTTMRLDLERTITNFEENMVLVNKTIIEEEKEYNILDIDFNNLAENESNETIKDIHLYMANSEPTDKNEYTAMFAGKNLIVIVAEAFSPIAINEEYTPTLYKLYNEGFRFTNFYTPIYYVSTSDGEYVSLTSLLPKESVWSFTKSANNYLPYTYGNLFKNLDYTTYAFHNGKYKYYNRNLSHPNMGYTYKACGNGLENKMKCNIWPQSDLEMIDATFDYYSDSEHFMTYYMSISGHLEYNFYGNNMAYKNRNLVKNMEASTAIKAYIATQIELDKAVESLIQKLDDKGILDDTVIVISADHYPYGLTNDEISEVMDIQDEKFDIHKNNLIIWNSEINEPIIIDKYAMSLDILPTVLNLFGIEFDSRLLMGRDILSSNDGLVIFSDRSWITKYGKYDAKNNIFTPLTKEKLADNYVEEINTIVYNKYVISKNILESNYYKYVFKVEE